MRILVVDNFSTMRRMVRNLFKELGYNNVEEAEDGSIALDMLRNSRFDFAAVAWNMRDMSGLELLQNVRGDPIIAKLPVLIMSAQTTKEIIVDAAQAGASGYIVKPFTAPTLDEKVNKILEKLNL